MFKTQEETDTYFNALMTADENLFLGAIMDDESILIGRIQRQTILGPGGIPTSQAIRLRGHNLATRHLGKPGESHWKPTKSIVGSATGRDLPLVARMVAETVAKDEID